MKYYFLLFFPLLLVHPLQAQPPNRDGGTTQSRNSVADPVASKLLPKKLDSPAQQQASSPFPGIRDYGKLLSEWSAILADSVVPEQQNLKSLVQAAVVAMPNNNPDQPHQMEGFYRMVTTKNGQYTKLIEAVLTIQDTDYKQEDNCDNLKMQLKQLRQTTGVGVGNDGAIKRARVYPNNTTRGLAKNYWYRLNQANRLRGAFRPGHIFNVDGWLASGHLFKLTHTQMTGNDTLYTVAFEAKGTAKYSIGYLIIHSSDQAIVEYEHANYIADFFTGRIRVKCRKQAGKYYPEFIRYEVPQFINGHTGEDQLDIHTLWIDTVAPSGFKAIRNKDQINCDQEIQTFRLPYDATFWMSYKMLNLHPLEPQIKVSLEASGSLDKQFRDNAQ